MSDSSISSVEKLPSPTTTNPNKRWTHAAGAWLGIGTSPGTLLLGVSISQRYGGSIPYISILLSFILMFALLWYQGLLGLNPPIGEGHNLTQISSRYFGKWMQRVVAALIAIGMIGWFGFSVGLGGAAVNTLMGLPNWAGPMILGIPILLFSLRGIRSWNGLAALTTVAVLLLVGLIFSRLGDNNNLLALTIPTPANSVRAPDFTAGMNSRRDLIINILLLCVPIVFIAIAGVGLHQGNGSADLVAILAAPGGIVLGNILITLSVIAPTLTTLFSGAPALHAATGIKEIPAMVIITAIGLTLAILRFDRQLLSWVIVLAAMLPPLVVPLAVESTRRRRGYPHRILPIWLWLPGALVSMGLTFLKQPLAPLLGLLTAGLVTTLWYIIPVQYHYFRQK
jgi:cytosine permease